MINHLLIDAKLAEIRASHARLRRDAEHSRAFREAKGKHRYRSRHRRT